MSYKLINKTTQEEHICSKVVIDGFDYYVSKEIPNNFDWVIGNNCKCAWVLQIQPNTNIKDYKKVIATNNPNIDLLLLQVIDKVEELAETISTEFAIKEIWKNGYKKSQETHSFNEDDVIEFAKWFNIVSESNWELNKSCYIKTSLHTISLKSTKQLLELWKEQQSEVIYFN